MKYMLMIVGDESWMEQPVETLKAVLERHQALEAELRTLGKFHGGGGLASSAEARTVRRDGNGGCAVTDGPFAETKEVMGGYYIIEAESVDEAVDWAKRIPSSVPNAVEVRAVLH